MKSDVPYTVLQIAPRVLGEQTTVAVAGEVTYKVFPEGEDPTSSQFLRVIESAGLLDFWHAPAEINYSLEDGEPI